MFFIVRQRANFKRDLRVSVVLILSSIMIGCGGGFRISDLAKGDIDFVADAHYRQTQALLRTLCIKLYRRNPAELAKGGATHVDQRLEQLFFSAGPVRLADLGYAQGTEALTLALDPEFRGDRVLALMAGLVGMYRNAYDYRAEFFMFDQLDERKLYQSARNTEILLWRLKASALANGRPLVLTNSLPGEPRNLSFERLFGKLIALQDMMAEIVSQQNDRLINKVTQNVASMVFFPL